jgi:4-amino-4-deoxy-L-arabinose transferase-like glycosyltransferase
MSFDYLWWGAVAFFTGRLLATDNPRWWLGIGASIGLGMLTKFTIAYFVAGLAAGVLLTPARRYLRSPWLWAGAGVALLIYLPNLIWQAQHSFISLDFLTGHWRKPAG